MKFLCVPCDTPMKLRALSPPERGSLSVAYECPECGYEMAMLTNPFETQLVQSLGVRIGPAETSAEADTRAASGLLADGTSATTGCPFAAMMPATNGAPADPIGESIPVRWTSGAEARLANIPAFVRPMARTGIEKFARDKGTHEVDEAILDSARDFFGM